jgi:NADPH:quinone reductase-like Zn-dependent oxidoreductase
MIPNTMRAAVLRHTGGPEALTIEDVPVPAPGPAQVLLKVAAAGVSYHDIVERNGVYKRGIELPTIPGIEAAGTVVAMGDLVGSGIHIGDRVAMTPFHGCGSCRLCRSGFETSCRDRKSNKGGYAQYMSVYWDSVAQIPDSITMDEACMLGAAAGVALNAVRDVASVRLGDRVLITGASGGIGIPSIQLAKASGAWVLAHTRSDEKAQELLGLGADDVIVSGSGDDFSDEVRARTDGGVDVVIDTVGSPVFAAAFRSLDSHGRYAVVGQLVGEEIKINLARIFFKRISLAGVGSVSREQLRDVIKLVDSNQIRPCVAKTFTLDEIVAAHSLVESGTAFGRVVVQP